MVDGVQARLNTNNSITLFNNDGGQIVIADAAGQGAAFLLAALLPDLS